MYCYEVYETAAEKRKAQKGAQRGKPTGKAVEYLLTFPEHGRGFSDLEALAPCLAGNSLSLCVTGVAWDYLRQNCRRIGYRYLPAEWKQAFDNRLRD